MGRIGRQVARRAKGFEMRVLYYDERRNEQAERDLGVSYAPLERILAEADFVSVHVPLMPTTRHLIDAAALRKMKRTAVLINTSRGPVVDEHALAEALRDKIIAAAGIDVFEREPAVDPLLLEQESALLLPHVASGSEPTRTRMAVRAAENILAFLDGKPLLDPVPA
jgi:lactate dehydrogenase-like 2-hydroxyacid dehydrogenase